MTTPPGPIVSSVSRSKRNSTFRKRVGLFLFEPTGTTEDWALRSFETALGTDLTQLLSFSGKTTDRNDWKDWVE